MINNRHLCISVLLSLFLSSLIVTNTNAQAPIVEMEKSPEWIEYNKKAVADNLPILDRVVFCGKVGTMSKKPEDIKSVFSLKDKEAYTFVHWNNVFGNHIVTIKTFDPRGILFHEWDASFSHRGPGWNLWTPIYISNAPASKLPGQWTSEIYMDGKLATRGYFLIGDNRQYEKVSISKESPAIGIINFFNENRKIARFNFRLPSYIGQMFTIDFPKYRTVLPWESGKIFKIEKGTNIKESMSTILNSSSFSNYITKHNLNVVFIGYHYDGATVGEDKIFYIYMIDAKKKLLVKEMTIRWTSRRTYENEINLLILDCAEYVYEKILSNCTSEMNRLLGQ